MWLLLLLPPVVVGLLNPHFEPGRRWPWWAEILAAALSLLVLPLLGAPLASGRLRGRFMSSDLHEYCGLVATWETPMSSGGQRSALVVSAIGQLLEPLGVIDALGTSALLAGGVLGLGLYFGGRAASNPVGGLLAACSTLLWEPALGLTRTITVYPVVTAGFVLVSGVVAMALRFRRLPWVLCAAVGAASCFLLDPRGLVWGLGLVPLVVVAAALAPAGPRRWLRVGVGLAFIVLCQSSSYVLGRTAYAQQARSLEELVLSQGRLAEVRADPNLNKRSRYVWGWTRPSQLPATIATLREGSALMRQARGGHAHAQMRATNRGAFVDPWTPVWIGGGVLALLGLLLGEERRWRLLALAPLPLAAVTLEAAIATQHSFPRQLAQGVAAHALPIGLAWVALMAGPAWGLRWLLRRSGRELQLPSWLPQVLALVAPGVLLALALGWPASPLGPQAAWRGHLVGADHHIEELLAGNAEFSDELGDACTARLQAEERAGREPRGLLWTEAQ